MFARPGLPSFDYLRPTRPGEVVGLLEEHGPAARLLMGGTDLLPRLREGLLCPRCVVDVKAVPGLRDVRTVPSGLEVGAAVSLNALARDPATRARYPLLVEAADSVASYQVRNRATLGGNLCNASPAADTAPAILALDGVLVVHGREGLREIPAERFFVAPGRTSLAPAEFVVAIRLPEPSQGGRGTYRKLGRSRAGDLAVVGVAVYGFPDESASSGFRFRIALASVAPVPMRAHEAEELLGQCQAGESAFRLAAEAAAKAASPIDDVRASAGYRSAMVRVLTLRGLRDVWRQLGEAEQGAERRPK